MRRPEAPRTPRCAASRGAGSLPSASGSGACSRGSADPRPARKSGPVASRRGYSNGLSNQLREAAHEGGVVVQRLDSVELQPELGRALAGLDFEVPQDLEVVA